MTPRWWAYATVFIIGTALTVGGFVMAIPGLVLVGLLIGVVLQLFGIDWIAHFFSTPSGSDTFLCGRSTLYGSIVLLLSCPPISPIETFS